MQQKASSEIFNIPNAISIIRIMLIAPFVYYFILGKYYIAAIFLIISGLSDAFDGMIARKLNQITKLGILLDPIADKLTLIAVVICLMMKFTSLLPIVILMFVKEVSMMICGAYLLKNKILPPPAQWYGKVSTTVFYVAVIIIVGMQAIWGMQNHSLTITLMAITAVCMVYTVVRYAFIFIKLLKQNNSKVQN